jgi:putrescine transport system substrate-binding protein
LIFDPETVSKFADCGVTLLDSAAEVIGMTMLYLGHDANSVAPEHLEQAERLLRSIRPYVKYFSSTKLLLDLPSKEVCIAMSWSGDYSVANRRAAEAGIDLTLGYTIPTEGSLIWFDTAFIPADAANVYGAHLFLNFIMRPDVIAEVSNFIGYANANLGASELMDADITSDLAIYPDEATIKRLSSGRTLPPKLERLRSRVWTRVKSGL